MGMGKFEKMISALKSEGLLAGNDELSSNSRQESLPRDSQFKSLDLRDFGNVQNSSSWKEALGARQGKEFDRAFCEVPEDLAWYLSYHFDSANCGIYLTEFGIELFADWILQDNFTKAADITSDAYALALAEACELLVDHENFHHQVEVAVSRIELLTRRKLYVPSRKQRLVRTKDNEEALATSQSITSGRKSRISRTPYDAGRSIETRLAWFPPGYRDAKRYKLNSDWELGKIELLRDLCEFTDDAMELSQKMLKSSYGNLFRRNQRLYMVEEGTPLSRVFTESASSLYIQIHPDDLIKRLGKTFGYQIDHQKGSHRVLKSPREGFPVVPIPLDNPVTRTVLLSIMRRMGYLGQHKNFYKEIGLI